MPATPLPKPRDIAVDKLLLDPKNPRLPEPERDAPQVQLLTFFRREYDLIRLARSIGRHGYSPSEPLIALDDRKAILVLEGNRRLATLLTLLNPPEPKSAESKSLQNYDEWVLLSRSDVLPKEVPVVVVKNRADVAPIIGYRHIAGIEPWEPWAKARFVGSLVDDQGMTVEEVSRIVSESPSDVAAQYRNYRIVRTANDDFKIPTEDVQGAYGIFTRAMNSVALREHIGVPAGNDSKKPKSPVSRSKKAEVKELFAWLFGNTAVIEESRDIGTLAKVVGSADGLRVLRETQSLEEAEVASGGRRNQILKRLSSAASNLERAVEDFKKYSDDSDVKNLVGRCRRAFNALR